MNARALIAIVVVFGAWTAMDFTVHGFLIRDLYEQTAEMWRPMEEAKMGLSSFVVFVSAACFTLIYGMLITVKNMKNGLIYGGLFGLAAAISMAYGSYSYQPFPYDLVLAWFWLVLLEGLVGGAILALICKDPAPA